MSSGKGELRQLLVTVSRKNKFYMKDKKKEKTALEENFLSITDKKHKLSGFSIQRIDKTIHFLFNDGSCLEIFK